MMARALELARRGEALASPNPMVGAVVVRNGSVIGEGFHTYDGMRHAEVAALDAAGAAARGATLYVNLEPCSHTGRTPPCTRAIIGAGVRRVVVAMADPNPAVAGSGFAGLRAAGVAVEIGDGAEEARTLNEAFAKWTTTKLPLVTLKSALTLDHKLALPATHSGRRRRWISSAASRAEVQLMRHASDALLTGIGTVLADDPRLTDRSGLRRRRPLLRVVVDSRLRLPLRSRLVRSAEGDVLVFTAASEASRRARALRLAGVEVVNLAERAGAKRLQPRTRIRAEIDLRAVMAELGRRGILSVLLEAGSKLNRAALAAGLVDKARLFYAPIRAFPVRPGAAGDKRRKASSSEIDISRALDGRSLSRAQVTHFGTDVAVEGYLQDVYGVLS